MKIKLTEISVPVAEMSNEFLTLATFRLNRFLGGSKAGAVAVEMNILDTDGIEFLHSRFIQQLYKINYSDSSYKYELRGWWQTRSVDYEMKVIPRTYYDAKWRSEGWI
jgi:hypothetical protein